jgi:hypothetical protein
MERGGWRGLVAGGRLAARRVLARWAGWSRSRRAGVAVAVVATLAVVGGVLLQGVPRGAPVSSPAGSGAAATASPGGGNWATVSIPELPAAADLAPLQRDEAGVSPESGFTLASLTHEPAVEVAARLEATPTVNFQVTAGAELSQAILRPAHLLDAGQAYRFTLRGTDGRLEGSWSFRVRSPVHVLSTIPGDRATGVPTARGIELTFDQDGVADIKPYFSIVPTVTGRFERHGRTQVFVPDSLQPATVYTVTVRAGLPRTGTDLTLEQDVVVQFETNSATAPVSGIRFGRDAVEVSPAEAPVLGVVVGGNGDNSSTASIDVVVRRYPDEASAATAFTDFLLAPRWTSYARPRLAIDGLPVVARFSATLEPASDPSDRTFRFPGPLPAGWYAVELPGPPTAYAFLQVTRVSAWVAVLTDRTVVWTNDVVTGDPVAGASVAVAGQSKLATTDARGLAVVATPDALVPPAEANGRDVPASPPLLAVHAPGGASVLVAFEVPFDPMLYRGEWWERYASTDATYWSLLYTDRQLYRRSDRIETWGYLRGREDGVVPTSVALELMPTDSGSAGVSLAGAEATPSATGAYVGTVAFDRLPYGWYVLRAVVDGRVVSQTYLEIGAIRKPAYELAMTSDRSAIVVGESVHLGIAATFFDGSAVPSLPLHLRSMEDDSLVAGVTDALGTEHFTMQPPADPGDGSDIGSVWWIEAVPDGPEEGQITASVDVLVFASTDYISASGTLRGAQLTVTGRVQQVDIARVDRERAADAWNGDPGGAAIAGRTVQVQIIRLHQVRTQVGTYYDSVEKLVRPIYEYDLQRLPLATRSTTSGTDGSFSLALAVPSSSDTYEIVLTSQDTAGRTEIRKVYAGTEMSYVDTTPRFVTSDGQDANGTTYGVGDRISWNVVEGDATPTATSGSRYLFIVAQRGLLGAGTSTSPTFTRTFASSDAPGIFVMGIRFTGTAYAPKAATWATFKADTRALAVSVTTDRASYRPGEQATLTIRVQDTAGRPKAADVLIQAVDEKLFAAGAASTPDPLAALYAKVDSGILRLTATHQGPTNAGGEGEGGAAGGSGRTDFRDTLASRLVPTGANGVATLTLPLSDDLTSWHVVASAVTGSLEAGVGERLVPVGLPLFADVTLADEYLASDRPLIRLRAFGSALKAGDQVVFTVRAPSLGMAPTEVRGTAFGDVLVPLPPLTVGTHGIDVAVTAPARLGSDGRPLSDRLVRTISVVTSRVTTGATWYGSVGDPLPSIDTQDVATYTFTDAGAGRYLPLLRDVVGATSARIDSAIARDAALQLLVERIGIDARTLPPADLDLQRYPVRYGDLEAGTSPGIALIPDGGTDPWLAARIISLSPGSLPAAQARQILEQIRDGPDTLRDLRIASLAGLAAIGELAEPDLREALAQPDLDPTEQLYLALGFLQLGDDATARTIELDLLRSYGEQLGAWVRVHVPGGEDATSEATALLAVVAAGIGDPLAPSMIDYAIAFPSEATSSALELVTASGLALDRAPRAGAAVAYTVDGTRTEAVIRPGESLTVTLTEAQRRTLRLERLSGAVGVTISWRRPADVSSMTHDPALTLTRTQPTNPIAPTAVVTIDLHAALGAHALRAGCYEVVEEVPSGLVPIIDAWSSDEHIIWPASVQGQEVRFCVSPGTDSTTDFTLRYAARVVNAGTFAWEPATMQHDSVAAAFTATDTGEAVIASR